MITRIALVAATLLFMALGCSFTDGTIAAPLPPPDVPAGCNPISGNDCLSPFPSTFHEVADPTTATGMRVSIAANAAPVQESGVPLAPDRLNQKDGFSPSTPFVVSFPTPIEGSGLGNWKDPSISLTPQAPVQVLEYATGNRVLAFGEVDANALPNNEHQGLLIHPLVRLKPATRYVIAIVGLKDINGADLTPAPFRALRDQTPLSASLAPLAANYEEIFALLASAGVPRSSLTLAWDVVTASDATATGHLVQMRDQAFQMLSQGQLGYSITSSMQPSDPNILAVVLATVKVPWFLKDQSSSSMMNFGADGQPAMTSVADVPITIVVPACAATAKAPLPVVVFGHGLFQTAESVLPSPPAAAAANQLCMMFIGTDWIGLAAEDATTLPGLLTSDLNNFYVISDRLQQAHVNAQTMTRMFLTTMKDDAALQVGESRSPTEAPSITSACPTAGFRGRRSWGSRRTWCAAS